MTLYIFLSIITPPLLHLLRDQIQSGGEGIRWKAPTENLEIRRVKCDEGKPACYRCTSTGRKCDGYAPHSSSTLPTPHDLAAFTAVVSTTESRALEFFYQTTSPRLAGFLDGAFWKRSVLQLSLSEPSVRQALAALGLAHECEGFKLQGLETSQKHEAAVQLYTRAIRSTIEKASLGEVSVPVVVVASILFTCFEFFRRNAYEAAKHIASGIKILQYWRKRKGSGPRGPWGQTYSCYETYFIENELAPILTMFSLNASEFGPFPRSRLILNPVDGGGPKLAEHFETLQEARVGLVDLVTASANLFQKLDEEIVAGVTPTYDALVVSKGLRTNFGRWKANFDDLLRRRESTWRKEEKAAADVIRIMRHGAELGLAAYVVSSESDWDHHRGDYEEILRLIESFVSNLDHYPDELSKALSLELGLIYPLHAVAWKCRWPRLRRKGLELLLRTPRREWILDPRRYHAIFTRIMEIEENYLNLSERPCQNKEDALPPENMRVHDFYCFSTADPSQYTITFSMKSNGIDGPWDFITEYIHIPPSGDGNVAPSNLFACRRWASAESTDQQTADMLKSAVFGEYQSRN
ncbi:hypothetical protein IFM61606_09509 [Aspergillus udagawae]|nr:hypothetical protein IFM61606_09509 [Aspergillus udagawae]GFG18955.1 hypothetical protein IFM5058_09546 [Aspergillus udagawae]